MKKDIVRKLEELEKKHNVKILWAIESGSRAWGFASDDSDYDIRCMHIGRKEDYLGLFPPPAQINLSEGDLDIESWDIRKFAELTLKSNPQIAEWLRSPVIYRKSKILSEFREIFDNGCSLEFLRIHYIRMAKQNYHKYMGIGQAHSCKKYLYVLRGLACAIYIEEENKLPPLPYKQVIPYLPSNIQNFFEKCVMQKNSTEKAVISADENTIRFIESSLTDTSAKEDVSFRLTDKLNKYLINILK